MTYDEGTAGKFTVVNDEGKEVVCEVLFTYDSDETHKSYIVYTDNTLDEEGNTKVFASTYVTGDENAKLMPIETEKEWAVIETILEEIQNHVDEENPEINHGKSEESGKNGKDAEEIDRWIADMKRKIDFTDKSSIFSLSWCEGEITQKILDNKDANCKEDLVLLMDELNKKLPGVKVHLGMAAYAKGQHDLAERMFIETDSKNNLAYIARRGEVPNPEKYTSRYVAELLKDGVKNKDSFSMINMALLWALNVGGNDSWKLADNIMAALPEDQIGYAHEWWYDVAKEGDIEGYLVLYWLMKWNKKEETGLGTKEEMRKKIVDELKYVPDFI